MGFFETVTWPSFVTVIGLLVATRIALASGGCADPGTPLHGYRRVSSSGTRFGPGTVVRFYCNADYTLVGSKKLFCETNGQWLGGKIPTCAPKGCPLPPPSVAHAHVISNPVSNTKGSYVEYSCDPGFVSSVSPIRLLCDKNKQSQDFFWNGSFSCQRARCPRPQAPWHGNVTFTSLYYNSTSMYTGKARYSCQSGYILKVGTRLYYGLTRNCTRGGYWSYFNPSCEKICDEPGDPEHGYISKVSPQYYLPHGVDWNIFIPRTQVTFVCGYRYRLRGSGVRTCRADGKWSGREPQCVVDSCGSPGNLSNGLITSNSTGTGFTIWTVVTFKCLTGFQLSGVPSRQCRPSGSWTGYRNPSCEEVTCEDPGAISHGQHMPHGQASYRQGTQLEYECFSNHILWGSSKFECKLIAQKRSDWVALDPDVDCLSPTEYDDKCKVPPDCLLLAEFEERCKQKSGYHLRFLGDKPTCLRSATPSTPAAIQQSSSSSGDLDKMTIVVATAGSTLGALVVLLTALVCVRRFHRSRRFRHSAFRSRRYSDDERIAIIAAYTGDVHFILPSYDEAMSQEERSPPSFDSVVQGQGENNQALANNNNPAEANAANAATNTRTDSQPESARLTEVVDTSSRPEESTTGNRGAAEEQSINIVSNPLAEPSTSSALVEAADQGGVDGGNVASDECAETDDSFSIRRSESLPSSSSEDDLTSSQTQPLLGQSGRGVMV